MKDPTEGSRLGRLKIELTINSNALSEFDLLMISRAALQREEELRQERKDNDASPR